MYESKYADVPGRTRVHLGDGETVLLTEESTELLWNTVDATGLEPEEAFDRILRYSIRQILDLDEEGRQAALKELVEEFEARSARGELED